MKIFVSQAFQPHCGQSGIPQERVISVIDKVLENDHPQAVTVIVKLLRLHLDMLAQGIETKGLHLQNVLGIAFRAGWCEKSVTPIALVQKAMEEIRLPIETKAGDPLYFPDLQSSQRKVGGNNVLSRPDDTAVEIGVLRGPEAGRFQLHPRRSVFQRHLHHSLRCLDGDKPLQPLGMELRKIGPGLNMQTLYILPGNAFQPHRLPDTGNRRVPHSAPLAALFSIGQDAGAQVILHPDYQDVYCL